MVPGSTLIILVSWHHGNTRRVAEAMAEVLAARIVTPEEVRPEQLDDYELIGWGSGIYFGSHATSLRQLAGTLSTRSRSAFLFSTAGLPCLRSWFHAALRQQLRDRGCRILGEFSCRGWDTVGPLAWFGGIDRRHPDEKDLERARDFARSLTATGDFGSESARG